MRAALKFIKVICSNKNTLQQNLPNCYLDQTWKVLTKQKQGKTPVGNNGNIVRQLEDAQKREVINMECDNQLEESLQTGDTQEHVTRRTNELIAFWSHDEENIAQEIDEVLTSIVCVSSCEEFHFLVQSLTNHVVGTSLYFYKSLQLHAEIVHLLSKA